MKRDAFVAVLCTAAAIGSARAEPLLTVDAAQRQALGIQTSAAQAGTASAMPYPARVVLPSQMQRIVAAPLPGLVAELKVDEGARVRRGDVVAVVLSQQAGELARERHTAESQAQLADAAQSRDEALFSEGLISKTRLESSQAAARQAGFLRDERRQALARSNAASSDGVMVLRAPTDGVILERMVAVGQRVEGSTSLVKIGRLEEVWLDLQVPAPQVKAVAEGDKVTVEGVPRPGQVLSIGSAVDAATQTVLVRARFAWHPDLRIGQAVVASIHRRAADGAQSIPQGALTYDAGKALVFVTAGRDRYRAAEVTVQNRSGDSAVVGGLPPGSQVVVSGVASLKAMLASTKP